jgi:hypothetical protein
MCEGPPWRPLSCPTGSILGTHPPTHPPTPHLQELPLFDWPLHGPRWQACRRRGIRFRLGPRLPQLPAHTHKQAPGGAGFRGRCYRRPQTTALEGAHSNTQSHATKCRGTSKSQPASPQGSRRPAGGTHLSRAIRFSSRSLQASYCPASSASSPVSKSSPSSSGASCSTGWEAKAVQGAVCRCQCGAARGKGSW